MKIFIDDERMPLESEDGAWVIVRFAHTALNVIDANAHAITHISFDNDLADSLEGRDIMQRIFGTPAHAPIPLPRLEEIRVHSANTVAAREMIALARNALEAGVIQPGVNIIQMSALDHRYHTVTSWYDDAYESEKERQATLPGLSS
jgi:hypothetical protein